MSQETFRKLRQMLMEKLDVCQELTDQEILETIDELILDSLRESGVSLKEKVQLRQELFYSVRKLDVLQELIEDETVTEIMVNGPDSIFVERKGRLTKWPKSFTDQEKLEDVIQQIVGKCNRIVNESSGCKAGDRSACQCGYLSGSIKRSYTHHTSFSRQAHHHGEADRVGKRDT